MLTPLWNGNFEPLDIFLPVGISFFTFQSLSYTIDVYRRQLQPLERLLDYVFYVSFFPQLVQVLLFVHVILSLRFVSR